MIKKEIIGDYEVVGQFSGDYYYLVITNINTGKLEFSKNYKFDLKNPGKMIKEIKNDLAKFKKVVIKYE